ncbi:PucR family transcriptional regulator [Clostridium psychrophilum]|uniref:PucR family transcriptional regulator n=1 Tax=Clostridium psychrophilum TaxID=132926 RepID=UPI001C0BEBEC|nr:helix-turn-helix domain-containing protein [Clostridium psychrophilum]MBU3182871.1 helix-turn-helix domain-containing protein [Clostridium psychrophilum]
MITNIIQELYKLLFDALSKGGFEEITKAAYSYMKHPIVLIDVEYKVLSQVPHCPLGDPIRDTLLKENLVPSEMIWDFDNDNYVKTNRENNRAFLVDWGMVANLPRIMVSVRVNGQIKGYMGILYPDGKCAQEDLASADIIVQAFAMEFSRIMKFSSELLPLQNVFLSELFHGHINNQNQLKEWSSHVNLTLSKGYCLLAIQPTRATIDSVLLQYIHQQFEKKLPSVLSIVFDECIYLLITTVNTKSMMDSFVKAQMQMLKPILVELHLLAGISDRFDNLLDLRPYLYQAKHALTLGKLNPKCPMISVYNNLVLENILSTVRTHMEPQNYMHPTLSILEKHDNLNGTEYLTTLKTYMTSMCNSTKTSKALNIHRNTLLYRLNRIVQLTDINLDNQTTCAHLILSFYLK